MSDSWDPMDYSLPGTSVHGILQEFYWSGLPFLSAGDLPDPGIELRSPALQADSSPTELLGKSFLGFFLGYVKTLNQIFLLQDSIAS